MKILPIKLKQPEVDRIEGRLRSTIDVWTVQWGYKLLEDMPAYVQDAYMSYCYILWLEDQLKIRDATIDKIKKSLLNRTNKAPYKFKTKKKKQKVETIV